MKKEILKSIIKVIFKDVDQWAEPYCDLDLFEIYVDNFLSHTEAELIECFKELGFTTYQGSNGLVGVSPVYDRDTLVEKLETFIEENC